MIESLGVSPTNLFHVSLNPSWSRFAIRAFHPRSYSTLRICNPPRPFLQPDLSWAVNSFIGSTLAIAWCEGELWWKADYSAAAQVRLIGSDGLQILILQDPASKASGFWNPDQSRELGPPYATPKKSGVLSFGGSNFWTPRVLDKVAKLNYCRSLAITRTIWKPRQIW